MVAAVVIGHRGDAIALVGRCRHGDGGTSLVIVCRVVGNGFRSSCNSSVGDGTERLLQDRTTYHHESAP